MRLRGVDLPGQGIRGRSYVSALRLRQRSGAAVIPDWDAKLLRLVGEVRRDARAGEYDHTDREDLEDSVVALERRGPGVPVPVGLEDDLRHVAVISPAGGDAFRALGTAAMQQYHFRMLAVDLVERRPDRGMIVEVEAAGEGNLWSDGKQNLDFGAAFSGEKIAAINHCGGSAYDGWPSSRSAAARMSRCGARTDRRRGRGRAPCCCGVRCV